MLERSYPLAHNEAERLAELHRYHVLDSAPEAIFNDTVSLARSLFGVATSVVSLVDDERQWFKAKAGLDACETGRSDAFCTYAILSDAVMVVPDTHADKLFVANPLVTGEPHIRFYAGAPLTTPRGFNIGTLCIFDPLPRPGGFGPTERRHLQMLAQIVIDRLEGRRLEIERLADGELAGTVAEELTASAEQLDQRARALSDLSRNGALKTDAAAQGVRQLVRLGGEVEGSLSQISGSIATAAGSADAVGTALASMSPRVDGIAAVAAEISAIARRSRMLSINATIEAARAGDAGRGFSVVAHEVKQLAVRTADATSRIDDELQAIKRTVLQVGQVCDTLVERMHAAVDLSRSIGTTAVLQAQTRGFVGNELDETVQSAKDVGRHAARVGQASSALLEQAAMLRQRVSRIAA